MEITVVTPVGPRHIEIAERARTSVAKQTMPAHHIFVYDTDARGPAWARNRGIEQVTTEYIAFLDADDEIEPTFVARARSAIRPGHYVYTDWLQKDSDGVTRKYIAPEPDNVWCLNKSRGKFHIITALLRTEDVRRAGGFDERMTMGGEDKEFWYRLKHQSGICGIVIHEPLAWYHAGGTERRSQNYAKDMSAVIALDVELTQRYGGNMACCGGSNKKADFTGEFSKPQTFEWEKAPRQHVTMVCDTLVEYKVRGNRTIVGRVTGYTYPRGSYPKRIYIDRRDAVAASHDWYIVPASAPTPATAPSNAPANALSTIAALIDGSYEPPVQATELKVKRTKRNISPARVITIAQEAVDEG